MIIQYASSKDLKKIAQCHIAAFPQSVTSLFGVSFVEQMLQWYLSSPNKFLFWIEHQNQCIGYCGGLVMDGTDDHGSATGMTQFGFSSAVKMMLRKPWLFFHPEIRARYPFIIRNIKRKFKHLFKPTHQPTTKPLPLLTHELTAGLVVIGVNPSFFGKGLGSQLQQEFERKAKEMGALKMQLSVRKENDRAIRSYKLNGWTIAEDQKIGYLMVKTIFS